MQKTPRFPQLYALRGVAALSVFFHHFLVMMPVMPAWLEKIQFTPLHFFYDGTAAVVLFFVLSGLVLNLKYASLEIFPAHWVSAFIINRIFRIYPAFLAAIGLSLFLRYFLYVPSVMPAMSASLNAHWGHPLNIPLLLKLFTLVLPGLQADQIDPPMWSLMIEMRVSLFFPVIIFGLARCQKIAGDLIFLGATYVLCFFFNEATFHSIPLFVLGAVCAKHFGVFRSWLGKFNGAQQILWLAAGVLLYETVSMTGRYPHLNTCEIYVSEQLIGLGAAAIILGSVFFKKIAMSLSTRPFHFIGRTSYSFYLVHLLFQLTPAPLVYYWTHSWLATGLAALILSYFTAWLMFIFVEKPVIKKGHAFAEKYIEKREFDRKYQPKQHAPHPRKD
jgi:peptidoglycan/LPS O-acetylase OafA/YrhL